jgi:hypothetical protein
MAAHLGPCELRFCGTFDIRFFAIYNVSTRGDTHVFSIVHSRLSLFTCLRERTERPDGRPWTAPASPRSRVSNPAPPGGARRGAARATADKRGFNASHPTIRTDVTRLEVLQYKYISPSDPIQHTQGSTDSYESLRYHQFAHTYSTHAHASRSITSQPKQVTRMCAQAPSVGGLPMGQIQCSWNAIETSSWYVLYCPLPSVPVKLLSSSPSLTKRSRPCSLPSAPMLIVS